MTLGGINAGWDETVPPDSENAGLGAQRIRSLETTIQQVLDSEHNFPASGGANTGYHRLGSGRVFFDVESNVSSSGTDGRLQVTSDTSRFFHVGSAGTMFLGGQASPQFGVASGVLGYALGQQLFWAAETGSVAPDSFGSFTVTYSAYSSAPFVLLTPTVKTNAQRTFAFLRANPGLTSVAAGVWDQAANSAATQLTVFYQVIGLRAL